MEESENQLERSRMMEGKTGNDTRAKLKLEDGMRQFEKSKAKTSSLPVMTCCLADIKIWILMKRRQEFRV